MLEGKLHETETVGEINLGIYEIPLESIVGTLTEARSTAFAGNFMPLLAEGSEFASKWQSLYSHHIRDGISDPIKVYEYLNRFYVVEGISATRYHPISVHTHYGLRLFAFSPKGIQKTVISPSTTRLSTTTRIF